jgi:molybdenum cofactor synthesis domain-containing protein
MTEVELIDKTEVWVDGAVLRDADLEVLAAAAAGALGLPPNRLYVTDYRDECLTFDVLVPRLRLEQVAGRACELLRAMASVSGVELRAGATVHSDGVLGVIAAAPEDVPELLSVNAEIDVGLRRWVSTRVAVVATGDELLAGEVRDTNLIAVREQLEGAGFSVERGGTVPDVDDIIVGRVGRLVGDGFGLVITTGGVGAEDKDRTVDAVSRLDPSLAISVLASYPAGHGRHARSDVRIAVAEVGWSRVVCLPGPTREVRVGVAALTAGLRAGADKASLADGIGEAIRTANRGQ